MAYRSLSLLLALMAAVATPCLHAADETTLRVNAAAKRQKIEGMGCGAIFYEGHITSLAERGKQTEQGALYDAMFRDMRTDFLHLMIRHDHEPQNDNADPMKAEFKDEWFKYAEHTAAIAAAAKKRLPDIKLYATLYTPPAWMKTNNDVSAGGKAHGTLKPGMELEFAEFCYAFLAWMHRHGHTVEYLSIANEPDWEHTQPGCWLTPDAHAELFAKTAAGLTQMARQQPGMPVPKLVAPNTLSAVGCATNWLPPLLRKAGRELAVVGCHDYDRRGDRWAVLTKAARGRPVWCTEWSVNAKDESPELIHSAPEYWLAMTEAFNGGATAWMAYDWVYPPRAGGEALIHVDWGKKFTLTKIYHGCRQWCLPLQPGMVVVGTSLTGSAASDFSKPGIKASAFASPDGKRLVIHAANVQDREAKLTVRIAGAPATAVQRLRTSSSENVTALPPVTFGGDKLDEMLPPRAMMTWLIGYPSGFPGAAK
ncbi:MAG TPA: hypothetical protein VG796_31455 [Verrucomicrobiales bacterium]|nr:hypothetical protein [Verrucomicrobiales bacterium]